MCENRERLIGYVYDECDAAERRVIEEHLESCHTCRHEIRGLRGVRQDLLAWDVPASEPVWRPIAPVRQEPAWRSVPAWALAAAACATLMVGAAGGAATYALMPRSAPLVAQVPSSTVQPTTATADLTAAELAALGTKVMERLRSELDTRVRQVSLEAAPRNGSAASGDTADLARRVNMLSMRQNELYDRVLEFATETQGIMAKQSQFERNNRMLVSYVQGGAQGAGGQ
jgi:hypothetical protein